VPYDWFVDRLRRPDKLSTWTDASDYLDTVRRAYRKDLWDSQDDYVEIWLEKDALSSFFANITRQYQVTLMVCRGFASISFLYEAAMDLADIDKPIYIYFFGDHDPSGRNIEAKIVACRGDDSVSLDDQHGLAQHFHLRRDAKARSGAGGHATIDAARRVVGGTHGDVAVEVGRREQELRRRTVR